MNDIENGEGPNAAELNETSGAENYNDLLLELAGKLGIDTHAMGLPDLAEDIVKALKRGNVKELNQDYIQAVILQNINGGLAFEDIPALDAIAKTLPETEEELGREK